MRKLNSFYIQKKEQKEKREKKELQLLSKAYQLERDFMTKKFQRRVYDRILYLKSKKKNEKN